MPAREAMMVACSGTAVLVVTEISAIKRFKKKIKVIIKFD
jgi:hypothetical protein